MRVPAALLLLLSLAPGARAATVAQPAPPFVPNFLSAVSLSLQQQPFYGSMLLNSFDFHLGQVARMGDAKAAAYLKTEIVGLAKNPPTLAQVAERLGRAPITEHQAGAMLLANAVSRPDQFRELINGLETLKPGLGQALSARFAAGSQANGSFAVALRRSGPATRATPEGALYNRRGELESLFDGSPDSYPSY